MDFTRALRCLRIPALLAFTAASATLAPPIAAHPAHAQRTVLAIVAHPDDELFFAPALAVEARNGARVEIVYATLGDAGPGVSQLKPGSELGRTRMGEALCASEALGLATPRFFDFGDGKLTQRPRDGASPAMQLKSALAGRIEASRADLVITWGPDGGYGHGDHRMVSAVVTQIIQAMPEGSRAKLLYPGIPTGQVPDIPQMAGWAETAPELLDVSYTYGPGDLAKTAAASQCHVTQFDAASRAGLAPLFHQSVWRGAVRFRSAF
ncbi:PIG-L family deacetylase [Altererythrobacter sp.]|nr:PIG-L family deacetylase [Altererythrobacter sp.]